MRGLIFFCLLFSYQSHALIFGSDDRVFLSKEDISKRGLRPVVNIFIKKDNVYTCTGSWISDRHILTARHCVANAKKILIYNEFVGYVSSKKSKAVRFYVDSRSGTNQDLWFNRGGRGGNPRPSSSDWAIIETESDDGKAFGHFDVSSTDPLEIDPALKVGAYHVDADESMFMQYCSYKPRGFYEQYRLMYRPGLLEFDCDMMPGASGASILNCQNGKCKIVGIYSGDYFPPEGQGGDDGSLPSFSHIYSNAAVRSENFISQVKSVLGGKSDTVKSFELKKPACDEIKCLDAADVSNSKKTM